MKLPVRLILATILSVSSAAGAKLKDNVVIRSNTDTYTLVPSKKVDSIVSIKRELVTTFVATRAPEDAVNYVYYDDFNKLDKASVKARGVKPIFKSATSAGIFHDDSRMCILEVPLTEVGKPVETRYELTYTRPDLEPRAPLRDIYPIDVQTVTFRIPMAYKGRYDIVMLNADSTLSVDRRNSSDGKYWEITISGSDVPAMSTSHDGPPTRYTQPMAILTGRFANPSELYRHMHAYTVAADPDSLSVKSKAIEITAGCDSDQARAAAIYRWVNDNIRYVAIEGGDLGHRPDLASSVLAKRYGDCKGSANLIKQMLRSVGLDGRLVWLGTVDIPYEYTDITGFSAGNHMIAAWVTPGDSIVYLDGTVGKADFGHIGSGIAGKQTLVEDGDDCIVGRVPVMAPSKNQKQSRFNLSVADDDLTGSYTYLVSGDFKSGLLNSLNGVEPSDRSKVFSRFIKEGRSQWVADGSMLSTDSAGVVPLFLTGKATIQRAVRKAGNKTYITLNLMPSLGSLAFDLKDRQDGGWLPGARRYSHTFVIEIPEGYSVADLPKPLHVDNQWVNASLTYSTDNPDTGQAKVTISFEMDIKKRYIPLADLELFNKDAKTLARAANAAFIINANQ